MVHIRGARALLVMPHRTFPLPDYVGKAVWRTCSLGGFAFFILAGPIEPFALRRDVHRSGNRMPSPNLTAREMALAALCNRRPTMTAQIIKASISFVTVAASVGSLFAISWIGLALLGF
jgi:hypothetical protein